ncbi:MAG: 50S ribosomal protein L22 [Patescibacteria group bacterium]
MNKKITAQLNYLRMAPRKVRLVANLMKKTDVLSAATQLRFLPKRASKPLLKLLNSAVTNAEKNFNLKKESLFIENITVSQGPTLKRSQPRAFGRAFPIHKQTSHITLELSEKNKK